MKKNAFKFLTFSAAAIVALVCVKTFASQTSLDPSFDTGTPIGFDQPVWALKPLSDGKILVGGDFTTYKGVSANKIIRLYSDGSKDTSLNIGGGFNNTVSALAVQSDGKIIVGGNFTTYSGSTNTNRIVRLNNDGTKDTGFSIGNGVSAGFNGTVNALAVQTDGKIIVGGNFGTYSGVAAVRILRLNTDGSRDTGFNIGGGFNNQVNTLAIQSDGKIMVGGIFTSYSGSATNYIARLNTDGTKDTSFTGSLAAQVNALAIQTDGKIIVGGQFSPYVVRLNTTGSNDSSFAIGFQINYRVNTLAIQSDGKIVIGNGSTNRVIRVNTNGTLDNTFSIGNRVTGFGSYNIYVLAIQSNGKVIVGGAFQSFQGAGKYITSLNTDGSKNTNFNIGNGFDNRVNALAVQSDGKVIAAGQFNTYNGGLLPRITRMNINGTQDTGFNIGNGFNGVVYTLALETGGKIIVGGAFGNFDGTAVPNIARLNSNGTRDISFSTTANITNGINALAMQSDGKIIVGGDFTYYNGIASSILRLNTNGTIDSTFTVGMGFQGTSSVKALAIQSDGKIVVGGGFRYYSGSTAAYEAHRIIRLNTDGTRDTSFNLGIGFDNIGVVYALAIDGNGKIVVGGNFTSYSGGTAVGRITRLNTDGTIDTGFNVGGVGFSNNSVRTLAIQTGNKILVGGDFTSYNGSTSNRFVRLNTDGSKDFGFDVANGPDNTIYSLAVLNGGKILVGGNFTIYNSMIVGYLLEIYGESDLVILPNSTNPTTVANEFTSKGYVQSGTLFSGSNGISLVATDGNIPLSVSAKNGNITLSLPANTQINKADNVTHYTGTIAVPVPTSVSSINDRPVLSAFKVGSTTESLKLVGGLATLSIPAPGSNIGDPIQILYSNDNGITWNIQGTTTVSASGVSFTTNHFTDFAIVIGESTGSFVINGDAPSTTVTAVTLNITGAGITNMRFQNDNQFPAGRSAREPFASTKAWTLSATTGDKYVYVQFDTDGITTTVEILTSDTIMYIPAISTGSFLINNGAPSTVITGVTLNITGAGIINMRFQNDNQFPAGRSAREPFAISKIWSLSALTGNKYVYAQFDTDGITTTAEILTNSTIMYTPTTSTGCIGAGCGDITLQITSNGVGYCEIGDSVNFGLTGYSASSRTLESLFPTVSGNNARFCNDLTGKASRTLDISSTDLFNITTNNPAHTIAGTNVFIKNPAAQLVQGVCTANSGSSLNQRISIGGINVPLLGKIGNLNEVCKISTSQVDLRVQIPAYQALGQYSGTLTITVPDLS